MQGLWLQDCKELLRTALVSGIGVVVEEMVTVVLHGGAETAAKMERRRRKRLSKRKTFNTLWCDMIHAAEMESLERQGASRRTTIRVSGV